MRRRVGRKRSTWGRLCFSAGMAAGIVAGEAARAPRVPACLLYTSAYVAEGTDLKAVTVTSLKLEMCIRDRWKRMRIFLKYQHVNKGLFGNGEYFSAAGYPLNPGMFKIGISWGFYD